MTLNPSTHSPRPTRPLCWVACLVRQQLANSGRSLLEILIVMVIIALLASLVFPFLGIMRAKATYAGCTANLKALHAGFSAYLIDHQLVWPQPPEDLPRRGDEGSALAKFWYEHLKDYGVTKKTFLCPADADNASALDETHYESTYLVTEFDEQPNRAYQWPNQPWVIESGDLHGRGKGPNMIFPDGRIERGMSLMLNLPQ